MVALDDLVTFGPLRTVRIVDDGVTGDPNLKSLIFQFEIGHVTIVFDEEYAILQIEVAPQTSSIGTESGSPAWRDLIGMSPSWAWVMTNQNGHEDGFQIEFLDRSRNETASIQIVTGAAELTISRVTRLDL